MKNSTIAAVSMLGGALLGATLAMFLTPKSGREMRQTVKKMVVEGEERFQKEWKKMLSRERETCGCTHQGGEECQCEEGSDCQCGCHQGDDCQCDEKTKGEEQCDCKEKNCDCPEKVKS